MLRACPFNDGFNMLMLHMICRESHTHTFNHMLTALDRWCDGVNCMMDSRHYRFAQLAINRRLWHIFHAAFATNERRRPLSRPPSISDFLRIFKSSEPKLSTLSSVCGHKSRWSNANGQRSLSIFGGGEATATIMWFAYTRMTCITASLAHTTPDTD